MVRRFGRLSFFPVFLAVAFFLVSSSSEAQKKIGFTMPEGKTSVEIPFEAYSNLIVIEVVVNGIFPLKFVLDTGAESIILTEKLYGDLMGLNYVRDITVRGAGVMDSLQAFVATNVSMSLSGGINGEGLNMLVLKEDYIKLSETIGEEIYGIIGYDIFSRFVVNIDYDANILTLYEFGKFKPRRSTTQVPLTVSHTKPYVITQVVQGDKKDTVKLMVDSGASHAVLLDVRNTEGVVVPKELLATRLGQGLGGEIPGFLGRMPAFLIDDFCFENILVSIPIAGAYNTVIKRGARHGTIGGDVLCRFNVTFDYMKERLYLRKGKEFRDPFEFDMSGMSISATGANLDSIKIDYVRKDTPAYYVGLKPGDHVLSINNMTLQNTKFSEITAELKKKDGKKIKIVILRNGQKIKKVFYLRRMI